MIPKLCLFCENFRLESGCKGFSEITPGYDFSMECLKNHWKFNSFSTDIKEYRKMMKKASTCKDYIKSKED